MNNLHKFLSCLDLERLFHFYRQIDLINFDCSGLMLFSIFLGFSQSISGICILGHIFTALHGMQTRYSDENSVRPSVGLSVRLSHACIVTKR